MVKVRTFCTVENDLLTGKFELSLANLALPCVHVMRTLCSDAAHRLDNFLTWLSNTQPTVGYNLSVAECTLCRQYKGSVPAAGLGFGYVNCPLNLPLYRFVIIQGFYEALSMLEVEVYAGWYFVAYNYC